MKCNQCGSVLDTNVSICPGCRKEYSAFDMYEQGKKQKKSLFIKWAIVACLAIAIALAAAFLNSILQSTKKKGRMWLFTKEAAPHMYTILSTNGHLRRKLYYRK